MNRSNNVNCEEYHKSGFVVSESHFSTKKKNDLKKSLTFFVLRWFLFRQPLQALYVLTVSLHKSLRKCFITNLGNSFWSIYIINNHRQITTIHKQSKIYLRSQSKSHFVKVLEFETLEKSPWDRYLWFPSQNDFRWGYSSLRTLRSLPPALHTTNVVLLRLLNISSQ